MTCRSGFSLTLQQTGVPMIRSTMQRVTLSSNTFLERAGKIYPQVEVVSRMPDNKRAQDVFPTRYRCNTCGAIKAMFARYGFDGCVYPHESEPYYSFNRLSYWLGVQHQRFAPHQHPVHRL